MWVILAGFGVGMVVGLTGMGGGALMTPVLVLLFGVAPLSAVSSDLVASAIMKPFGGAVHLRRGSVHHGLVLWLCVGSVPAAFAGVLLARLLGQQAGVHNVIQTALGAALLLAVVGLGGKAYLSLRESSTKVGRDVESRAGSLPPLRVRKIPTVLVGVVGGLIVGMTSVGSGSLIIIALLALYPALRPNDLVGTDLVQAVPLVGSAALAHLLFGDFRMELTASIVIGSIPGVLLGAMLSSRAPGGLIRFALALVLSASGLKLLGASTSVVGAAVLALAVVVPLLWMGARLRFGLSALPRREHAPT